MTEAGIVRRLASLVACDTQNPPRQINADSMIFAVCDEAVDSGFERQVWDYGDGHVSWFVRRGRPRLLFNVHLDTVPIGAGWNTDPLKLSIQDGKAYGRGSCDIKGAAAVLLEIAAQRPDHLALLFTTDEEGAGGCCVQNFINEGHAAAFDHVVVAEPTECCAVTSHRGFLSVKTRFHGRPGHSSEARALTDNANHQMVLWASAALELAAGLKSSADDPGSCFNMGLVDGGTKSNVIAGESFVHWSARLAPGSSTEEFVEAMQACAPAGADVDWEIPFVGQPLPAAPQGDEAAMAFCDSQQLVRVPAVDFWTEAALFSAAGQPALVLGPGNIAQAHQVDEWVELEQLEKAARIYGELVKNDG